MAREGRMLKSRWVDQQKKTEGNRKEIKVFSLEVSPLNCEVKKSEEVKEG